MNIKMLSPQFYVRQLAAEDAASAAALCGKNPLFYQHHPPMASAESLLEDMAALPPGKKREDKYFVGYYDGGELIALLDLIADYPEEGTAYIGFFMLAAERQGHGLGSRMVRELLDALRGAGFRKARLGTDIGNPQSNVFWEKNGFRRVGQTECYLVREREL